MAVFWTFNILEINLNGYIFYAHFNKNTHYRFQYYSAIILKEIFEIFIDLKK